MHSFKPLTSKDVSKLLDLTIKHDDINKIVTFLCALSAYSENDQFNISYNAPSSTGKSYIPTEIARLFPSEDVVEIAYCSPTAFFHDVGKADDEKKGRIIVDLSRKILVFLDQPHNDLLARLRPLLSHDNKEINIKITDKNQKQGLRTKDIILKGFPSVIFSTAGLRIDEQEATRFFLLSPEVHQEKIRSSISETIHREMDGAEYQSTLTHHKGRLELKQRIRAIKEAHINNIKIAPPLEAKIRSVFLSDNATLKPRHQRDIKRFISLIKSFALLNLWWRDQSNATITANEDDFDEAFSLWKNLSRSQELNLPPYVYNMYAEIILPAWKAKNKNRKSRAGLLRAELLAKHYEVYGRMLDANQLRQQILPILETAGLISQERDPLNKRLKCIYPTNVQST